MGASVQYDSGLSAAFLGSFQDETGWSRLVLYAWAGEQPSRLVQREADKEDPDPKVLSYYMRSHGDTGGMLLRFVTGWPVSQVTEDDLTWVCQRLAAEGKESLFCCWITARRSSLL